MSGEAGAERCLPWLISAPGFNGEQHYNGVQLSATFTEGLARFQGNPICAKADGVIETGDHPDFYQLPFYSPPLSIGSILPIKTEGLED